MAEKEIELTYVVTVRTYGKPSKVRRSVGKIIARACRLNFNNSEVRIGSKKGNRVNWTPNDHDLGMVGDGD